VRPYLGAAIIIAVGGLAVAQVASLESWWARKQRARLQFKHLRALSPAEKRVLRGYTEANTKTQYFRMDDGVVGGLNQLGYIYCSAQVGYMGKGFAFNIQPWLWEHLQKNPAILGKAEDDLPDRDARKLPDNDF
jgi:Super-infection exclusion protein B